MASKPLNTLSQDECSDYYDILVKNAKSQWDIADTLSAAGQYGAATSHLLISIEESMKSIIVFMDTQGYTFRHIKGIDAIFRNHRIRFFIAYIMFAIGLIGEDFIKLLGKIKKNPGLADEYVKLFTGKEEMPLELKYYLLRKMILLKNEKELFKKADLFRQIGFYADYNAEAHSPQDMTQETYNTIYERMLKVKKFTASLIKAYSPSDETMKKLIANNKKIFNENKFYSLIERGLLKAKNTKDSPFDLLNDN